MSKQLEIRNSTAEFLIFQAEGKEDGIQVVYKDETIWCTQKAMAALFDVGVPAINKHLNNLYLEGEILREATVSKMETVQLEGKRDVKSITDHIIGSIFEKASQKFLKGFFAIVQKYSLPLSPTTE